MFEPFAKLRHTLVCAPASAYVHSALAKGTRLYVAICVGVCVCALSVFRRFSKYPFLDPTFFRRLSNSVGGKMLGTEFQFQLFSTLSGLRR